MPIISRRAGRIFYNAQTFLLVSVLVVCFGCAEKNPRQDEAAAAQAALRFAQTAFVEYDAQYGYRALAPAARQAIPVARYVEVVHQLHPQAYPRILRATAFEPMPDRSGVMIYLTGENGDEQFFYRLIMVGSARRGYACHGFFRANQPPALSEARQALLSERVTATEKEPNFPVKQ
ncbi:MAG: hypothetical protein NC924_00365 [Candidatus Omnitrophica bacterium]|nr:hypothetical protein [Candidatus Omnitrophota bacterium]